jgi:hypothetical protein
MVKSQNWEGDDQETLVKLSLRRLFYTTFKKAILPTANDRELCHQFHSSSAGEFNNWPSESQTIASAKQIAFLSGLTYYAMLPAP